MTNINLEHQINELWDEHSNVLLGYFVNKIGKFEDSQDLMAQTFARYYISQAGAPKSLTNPKAYLWKIADNLLKDYYKTKSTSKFEILHKTVSLEKAHIQIPAKEYDISTIISCVKKALTQEQFELLSKVYVDETNYKEISTNTKPATLRQQVSRSVQKAKDLCESKLRDMFS
jgi:DNA-directed RNA polymerase specialized sigma24 family protein